MDKYPTGVIDDNAPGWIWQGMSEYDDPSAYGGSAHAGGPGSYGAYTFRGTGVDIYAIDGPAVNVDGRSHKIGRMIVSIDGKSVGTYNLFQTDLTYGVRTCEVHSLSNTVHVLQIQADAGWILLDDIDVSGPLSISDATAAATKSAPVQRRLEKAAAEGWKTSGGMISSVYMSAPPDEPDAQSITVEINSTRSDTQEVYISNPPVPSGALVSFHVFLPTYTAIASVQPYVMQGAAGHYKWTGNWKNISELKPGWNTISVNVPTDAVVPLDSMGIQFATNGPWSGTCYIDRISW